MLINNTMYTRYNLISLQLLWTIGMTRKKKQHSHHAVAYFSNIIYRLCSYKVSISLYRTINNNNNHEVCCFSPCQVPSVSAPSCMHLIVTSMGHSVCCYLSALIDCLTKFERVGCVCLFLPFLMDTRWACTLVRLELGEGCSGNSQKIKMLLWK